MYKPHVKKLKRLYKKSWFVALYMRMRWAKILRAPYKEIESLIPRSAKVVDLGCGYGFFTNFLAISGPQRKIIGVEMSGERLQHAYDKLNNVQFIEGDITNLEIEPCDAIVIIHVLHHLPSYEKQEDLLKNCYDKLTRGGMIIIGEIDTRPLWKSLCSKTVDHLLYHGDFFHFRSCEDFKRMIEKSGFKDVNIIRCDKGIPFAHKVIVGTKS